MIPHAAQINPLFGLLIAISALSCKPAAESEDLGRDGNATDNPSTVLDAEFRGLAMVTADPKTDVLENHSDKGSKVGVAEYSSLVNVSIIEGDWAKITIAVQDNPRMNVGEKSIGKFEIGGWLPRKHLRLVRPVYVGMSGKAVVSNPKKGGVLFYNSHSAKKAKRGALSYGEVINVLEVVDLGKDASDKGEEIDLSLAEDQPGSQPDSDVSKISSELWAKFKPGKYFRWIRAEHLAIGTIVPGIRPSALGFKFCKEGKPKKSLRVAAPPMAVWDKFGNPSKAYLSLIAYTEGTIDCYNYCFGYGAFFDYSDHPQYTCGKKFEGRTQSASGRYQYLFKEWFGARAKKGRRRYKGVKERLGLKDFSPLSQDKAINYTLKMARAKHKAVYKNKAKLQKELIKISLEGLSGHLARNGESHQNGSRR